MKQTQPVKERVTITVEPAQHQALRAEAWRRTLEQRRAVSVSEVARDVLARGFAAQREQASA